MKSIITLMIKDYKLYFRNKLFTLITVVGMLLYIAFFFIMPRTVDETLKIGLLAPGIQEAALQELEEAGLILEKMDSQAALEQAIINKQFNAGMQFPADFRESILNGAKPRVILYFASDFPAEMKDTYKMLIQELINTMTGRELSIEDTKIVLGPDMAGKQIPMRNRMLPLLVFMLLIMETMGLANLITSEIQNGTIRALLVTRVTVKELFAGKGLVGISIALSQIILLLFITGGFAHAAWLVLTVCLLGSVLVTSIAFLIAAVSRDLMSVIAWGILAMIILVIPAFTVMFPGLSTGWIKIIPSFFMVDTLHRVVNFQAGWQESGLNLAILGACSVFVSVIGIFTLKRRLQCA